MTEPMTDHTSERTGERQPSGPSEPIEAPEPQDRCRACGARLTSGAPWCSLCFTPVTAPAPEAPPQPDDVTHESAHAPVDEQTHQVADELMARLAAERPAPSRLAGLAPSSGLARAGISVVGVVLVTGLAFGLMALLGSFL